MIQKRLNDKTLMVAYGASLFYKNNKEITSIQSSSAQVRSI